MTFVCSTARSTKLSVRWTSAIGSFVVWWLGLGSARSEWSTEREERFAGTSKAHSLPVLQLAIKAVFAHSQVPLVIIPTVGIGLFAASIVALVVLAIDFVAFGVPFPGFGTIVALMVMMFGILFCLLGIVSVYIGLIYEEVKGRPNFIVRQTLGLESPPLQSTGAKPLSGHEAGESREDAGGGIGRLNSDPTRAESPIKLSATEGDAASTVSGP